MANNIVETLSNAGWLTALDGPLHGIRHRRGLAIIGYVKTHHRRMLCPRALGPGVPELTAGERSGLFAMEDALYGCYLCGRPRAVGGSLVGHRAGGRLGSIPARAGKPESPIETIASSSVHPRACGEASPASLNP